jgi:hypothetical protein
MHRRGFLSLLGLAAMPAPRAVFASGGFIDPRFRLPLLGECAEEISRGARRFWMTPNQVRAENGLPAIHGADLYSIPGPALPAHDCRGGVARSCGCTSRAISLPCRRRRFVRRRRSFRFAGFCQLRGAAMIERMVALALILAVTVTAHAIASTYYEHHHTQRSCLWPVR